jgi:hypothetical protein
MLIGKQEIYTGYLIARLEVKYRYIIMMYGHY